MSRVGPEEADWKFRGLKGVRVCQVSTFPEDSRSSAGALFLSEGTAECNTSDDDFLYIGAELEGEVSPEALLMLAWLIPLILVSICHPQS